MIALSAPTGAIVTALLNPSTKTSSRGLRQCCLHLIWADFCGGVSNSIELSLVHIFHFILALCHRCTPFIPPASIIDGRPRLAISPLPCQFCREAIITLPLPCLCWSGAIVPLSFPPQHYHCIRNAATTTRRRDTPISLP